MLCTNERGTQSGSATTHVAAACYTTWWVHGPITTHMPKSVVGRPLKFSWRTACGIRMYEPFMAKHRQAVHLAVCLTLAPASAGNQDGLLPDGLHELGAKISQAPGLASAIARSALSSIPPAPTAQAAPQQQPSFTASPNTDQGQEQARKQSFLDGLSGGGGGLVALGTQMFGLMQQMDARLQCIEKAVGAVHSRLDKLEQMVLANNKGRNA